MHRVKFFEAASQLSNWVANLSGTTESALRQAEDLLRREQEPLPGAPPDRAILLLLLRAIGEKIEEVMFAFDSLCEAADEDARFELAFLLRDAPRPVQSEARLRLYGLPPGPSERWPVEEGDAP